MPIEYCAICQSSLKSEIEKRDTSSKADDTILWARKKGVKINRVSLARHRKNHLPENESKAKSNVKPKPMKQPNNKVSANNINPLVEDMVFLEAIRDRVYEKLIAWEIDLKIDSGFKAIELKNRLSDISQNEKLLLEILNEIRVDELKNQTLNPVD